MAYTSPSLFTTMSATEFRSQIETNFSLIQTALDQIQTDLPGVSVQTPLTNMQAVEYMTRPNGFVGSDSFVPRFTTDFDGFAIEHASPLGVSAAVFSNKLHQTGEAFSKTFEEIGITTTGDYVVKFGLITRGSPIVEMKLELEDTDNLQELTLWKMDVNRNVNVFTVTNLRRESPVLVARSSFTEVYERPVPLSLTYTGVLPTVTGRLPVGLLMPWNCEVMGAKARIETPPASHTDQSTLTISLDYILGTDATPVVSTATFDERDGVGAIAEMNALTPEPFQLAESDYVYPNITVPEANLTDFPAQASDLTVTLLVKEIQHDVLR